MRAIELIEFNPCAEMRDNKYEIIITTCTYIAPSGLVLVWWSVCLCGRTSVENVGGLIERIDIYKSSPSYISDNN